MRILILGSTGRIGRILVNEAVQRGHDVIVVVGHKSRLKITPDLLTVFEGTPLNNYTLAEAARGCDAILSTLNLSRTSYSPWAKLRASKDFLTQAMTNIIAAATEQRISRIVISTAFGVGDSKKHLRFWYRWLIRNSNLRYAYDGHNQQEQLLKQYGNNWTIVRPVWFNKSSEEKEVKVYLDQIPKASAKISRQSVASFMLDAVEQNLYTAQCPIIAEE